MRTHPSGLSSRTGNEWNELINIFCYTDEGRLVEEWVQTDTFDFLRQLGAVEADDGPSRSEVMLNSWALQLGLYSVSVVRKGRIEKVADRLFEGE